MLPSVTSLEGDPMFKLTLSAFGAALLALGLVSNSAQAQQPTRVFVAAQGSNANACSFALPCRTFQRAHDVVAAGGEIDVLDPAGYGALTITKAISIQGHDFSGITVPSGGGGITINAGASDAISLRGLIIEGAGLGQIGIRFNTGKSLTIENCVIRNLVGDGIVLFPVAASTFSISRTLISNNGETGICLRPSAANTISALFNRIALYGNTQPGLVVSGLNSTGAISATVTDSIAAANLQEGINAISG